MNTEWQQVTDATMLTARAVSLVERAAAQAIAERGAFHVVLSGGTTPRAIYEQLRALDAAWAQWHVYFGDERCVPRDDADRNSLMAHRAWLDHVPLPASQIHIIPAERGAADGAREYARVIAHVGTFDLVLLGLGEDGHTASLFPGHEWGAGLGAPDVLAVEDAPKPPSSRVSLSARRLSDARAVVFVVSGASKRDAVRRWRAGEEIPARAIAPVGGVVVLLDAAAG